MAKCLLIIVGFLLGGFLQPEQTNRTKARKNRPPIITSFSSSLSAIVRCDTPTSFDVCTVEETTINVVASDPDGDRLTYRYSVTGGSIVGKSNSALWSVKDVITGEYRAKVVVTDGKGQESSAEVHLRVAEGPRRELLARPCPLVVVQCPERVNRNQRTIFTAKIKGGENVGSVNYFWKVNWGSIVKGQGTREIEVELKEDWGENLTANLNVGGYDPSCLAAASCSSKIPESNK